MGPQVEVSRRLLTQMGLKDLCLGPTLWSWGGNVCARVTASAPRSLRSSWASEEEASPAATKQEEVWPALGDRTLVPMVEQLFSHLLKVVNICAHVLDDVAPGPAIKVTPRLGSCFQLVQMAPWASRNASVHSSVPSLSSSALNKQNCSYRDTRFNT